MVIQLLINTVILPFKRLTAQVAARTTKRQREKRTVTVLYVSNFCAGPFKLPESEPSETCYLCPSVRDQFEKGQ